MKKNCLANKSLAFLLALSAALLCGCGNRGQADPETTPTPTAAVLLAPTPQPQPEAGGVLRLSMPVNADTSDPLSVNTEEMQVFYSLIFESLITVDSTGMLIPSLAENWSCDESGKVWTLKLRAAARWQDTGVPISAADVVETFQRIGQLGGEGYYSYVTDHIEKMEAGENGTVVVTMKNVGLLSLYALDFPIVQTGYAISDQYAAGTGPYKIQSVTDEKAVLTANPNWWKQSPYIETIEFYPRDSNEIAVASYVAGQLDMVFTSSLSVGRHREEEVTNVLDVMTQTAELMLFNYCNSDLTDVRVRQAIAYSFNRSKIITNVYMNRAQACDVPIPPDSWLYASKSKVYDYNAEMALSLLAQAGWEDSDGDGYLEKDGYRYNELTLTILANESTDTTRATAAGQIAAQLEAIGIHVELVTAPFVLGDAESEYYTKLQNGEFDLALVGVNLSRDCDLTPLIASSGSLNYGKYDNSALEALMKNLLLAQDESACREAAETLQMRIVEELPFITLYFRYNSILYNADVKGLSKEREPNIMANVAQWYIQSNAG